MKINCELPNCMLDVNPYLNDYDFVLFHLYSTNKKYREYYLGMRKYRPNRMMILDNSAYEFFVRGEELDLQGYLNVIHELKPDMFIMPDVLMDRTATLDNTKQFMDIWRKYPAMDVYPIFVIQGNSAGELIDCANAYKDMGAGNIAVPFHNSFFVDYSCIESEANNHLRNEWRNITGKITKDDEYALGRIMFLRDYALELKSFKHVHLLGSHNPLEKKFEELLGFIKTMDTGYPVKCAIAGHTLGYESSKPEVIIDEFLDQDLSRDTRQLITANVKRFKSY